MDERLITIIKEPHIGYWETKNKDGRTCGRIEYFEYKLFYTREGKWGTEIRISSAMDEVNLVTSVYPRDFKYSPMPHYITFDRIYGLIEDDMALFGNKREVARNRIISVLKEGINDPMIVSGVRATLDGKLGDVDVCDLPFSTRLINILRNADICTLGDLLRVNKISLMEINGFGKKFLDEIKDFYAVIGYDFGTEFLELESGRGHYLPKKQQ